MKRLLITIVAFNNNKTLGCVLRSLANQLSGDDEVVIYDNASEMPVVLDEMKTKGRINCVRSEVNLGFCGGNNEALLLSDWIKFQFVLFLNPDVVLPPNWIDLALHKFCLIKMTEKLGILSGPLIKYDFINKIPLSIVDSLGIKKSLMTGRWKDVGQGQFIVGDLLSGISALKISSSPSAICGALILSETKALADVSPVQGKIFDEFFFAYKEDIDLCIRFKKKGYSLKIVNELYAFHGRGWNNSRSSIPFKLKILSARNDLYLNWKHRSPYLLFSLLKYVIVLILRI